MFISLSHMHTEICKSDVQTSGAQSLNTWKCRIAALWANVLRSAPERTDLTLGGRERKLSFKLVESKQPVLILLESYTYRLRKVSEGKIAILRGIEKPGKTKKKKKHLVKMSIRPSIHPLIHPFIYLHSSCVYITCLGSNCALSRLGAKDIYCNYIFTICLLHVI